MALSPARLSPGGLVRRSSQTAARRRRAAAERRIRALAVAATLTTGGVVVLEVGRVWRRGDTPMPADTDDVVLAAEQAIEQTVQIARAGYRGGTARENALLNLLLTFLVTSAIVRTSTTIIRSRGRFGPFRNLVVGERHIHHFVPGIALCLLAGGVSIVSRSNDVDPVLAVPFGAGLALTLDESALLLTLDDVYWTEEGLVSVQITLATLAMLSALALGLRVLRRGEAELLNSPVDDGDTITL